MEGDFTARGKAALSSIAPEARRFVLYCVTGVMVVAVHWTVMSLLLALGAWPLVSTSVGFLAGAAMRFWFSWRHVFEPTGTMSRSGAWFVLVLGIQFLLNGALFYLLTAMTLGTWLAQALTTALVTVFNYLAYRLWVFR